jgi:hypothetical protein
MEIDPRVNAYFEGMSWDEQDQLMQDALCKTRTNLYRFRFTPDGVVVEPSDSFSMTEAAMKKITAVLEQAGPRNRLGIWVIANSNNCVRVTGLDEDWAWPSLHQCQLGLIDEHTLGLIEEVIVHRVTPLLDK